MHGYSSSEESEDPKRPRPQTNTNGNGNDQKKKRKRRVAPQQTINKMWKRFSKRNFNTALSILPFEPVQPPAGAEHPNPLLQDGYERAAEECRRKVEKIVKDCKRVNMRYRDPGFDLDWDLKNEKGHTLNSLDLVKYELSSKTLLASSATVPKAVKRVHEIFDEPTFMSEITGADIKQGSIGDCWIIGAVNALANARHGISRLCVAHDTKIGIYGFVFYRDGEWVYSIIDDKLFLKSPSWDSPSMQRDLLQQIDREDQERVYRETYQTGSKALFFSQNVDQNETWIPLLEKAFAKAHGDYASLVGGWTGEGLEDLSGGVTTELATADILDTDEFWDNELSKVNHEFLFGCSTGILEYGTGAREGIQTAHAYVVCDARTLKSGDRLLKLRNPWGHQKKGLWEGSWSDGSKEWTREAQEELGHKFGSDSVFWISYKDFLRKFTHLDRTRLFREQDWRCTQRWIGVDVPWKAHYHEKFQIKLTKKSPLVIHLSQLDWRYFKGLQGQYMFRLHFRVHDQDRPDAEDYIVRSHGNYFTRRSVSVELSEMEAGNYTIYVMVTGERDTDVRSVEEVVKDELKDRVENEKLAQVGHAYDLAHSKAWDHMDKVAKLRKKRDFGKASQCRQKERRRNWEKRHLNRQVTKEQTKKNGDKKTRKRTEFEERQHKMDEEDARKEEAERQEEKIKKEKDEAEAQTRKVAEAVVKQSAPNHDDCDADTEDAGEDDGQRPPETSNQDDNNTSSSSSSVSSNSSPQDTPRSEDSTPAAAPGDKEPVPPVSDDGPPPAADPLPTRQPNPSYDSAAESSDSPVTDWEDLYSSDDMVRKPRLQPVGPAIRDEYDTEEEKMPDPWNAICIVGIRVYSTDEGLELRTVMEGGELLEHGMGEKGQSDLDNAQANAGGSRERTADPSARDENENENEAEDAPPYHDTVRHHDDGDYYVEVGKMGERHSDILKYIRIDSGPTTKDNSPCPTPMERGSSRQLGKLPVR